MEGEADEEGFVTVINKRSNQVLDQETEEENPKKAKKADKILPNFYQFNSKTEKKNSIIERQVFFNIDF
jgi:hypothetical protein